MHNCTILSASSVVAPTLLSIYVAFNSKQIDITILFLTISTSLKCRIYCAIIFEININKLI